MARGVHPLTFVEWFGAGDRGCLSGSDWARAYQAYAASFLADRGCGGGAGSGRGSCVPGYCVSGGVGEEGVVFAGDCGADVARNRTLADVKFGEASLFDTSRIREGVDEAVRFDTGDRRRVSVGKFNKGTDSGVVVSAELDDGGADAGLSVVEPVRGKHYESNRRKRLLRKNKRALGVRQNLLEDWRRRDGDDDVDQSVRSGVGGSGCGVDQNVPTFFEFVEKKAEDEVVDQRAADLEARLVSENAEKEARRTLSEKWAVENRLAKLKAEQAIKLLELKDLDLEAKKQASHTRMMNERNLVNMEKAHRFLKSTGNVPGFAQTVLSDEGLTDGSSASPVSPGECTISPDSSASMKEFRELMKRCADLEAKLEQFHKMTKIHPDYIELYKKQTWTINSENIRILDEMYPQGHALNPIPDYENYDAPTHGELIVGREEEYFPY